MADARPAQLRQVRKSPVQLFRHARICVIIGDWRVKEKRNHANVRTQRPRTSEIRRFSRTWKLPGADATERHAWNGRDLPEVTRLNSPNELAEPWKLQPRLCFLYSHQARRSDDEEGPSAQHKQSTVCGLLILRNQRRKKKTPITSSSHPRQNARNILKGNEVQGRLFGRMQVFPVPFPFPSSPRLSCAHLSIEGQADHIDAAPSP